MITFGLDYDGTYSRAPRLFDQMIDLIHAAGHVIVLVTQRAAWQGTAIEESVAGRMPIVWASGQTKEDAAREAGYSVDIWIEDNPRAVFTPLVYTG